MKVLVECCSDMALARVVGIPSRDLGHEGGKGKIMNRLRDSTASAVGLLDEDPGVSGRPAELKHYAVKEERYELRLLENRRMPDKRVVEIQPRLEEWLIKRSKLCGVDPEKYGLPNTAKEMHCIPRYDRKPGFSKWLSEMLASDEGLRTLQNWLRIEK